MAFSTVLFVLEALPRLPFAHRRILLDNSLVLPYAARTPATKRGRRAFPSSNSRDNNAFTINIAFIALEAWKMLAGYISINVKRQKIPLSRQ
jgi:hypothetical protein